MFDLFAAEDHGFSEEIPAPDGIEWEKRMKLAFEKEMLGIFVSDHPLKEFEATVRAAADYSLGDELAAGSVGWFAGMLSSVTIKPTKKGPMMAIVSLEDLDGSIEAVLFPQVLERVRDLVVEDAVLRVKGKVEEDDRGRKIIVETLEPFDGSAFSAPPKKVVVHTDAGALVNGRADALKRILTQFPGRDTVEMHVWDADNQRTVVCKMAERVNADANGLHAELMELFGSEALTGAAKAG
jgi:DNA polymerase-3 subunit alpha